ncbi:MAG TPA: lipopolysaccharide heptosyltransferase II [Candidatus Krumholzibacteria bacterium]|nr:lipopolysaccharide heptosyltransferase II [Candidatus Krumholzibacteria bacterium]
MARSTRLLVIAPSWLGDAVLSLPALHALADAGASVDLLARRGTERIFAEVTAPERLHPVSAASRWQRLQSAWQLRSQRYAAALVLPPSASAAWMAMASGAERSVGERVGGRAFLLTDPIAAAGRATHLSRAYASLGAHALQICGVDAAPELADTANAMSRWPWLHASREEILEGEEVLRGQGVEPSQAFLVLAPGARYGPAKRYPPERFAAAAATLARDLACAVVLVGGRDDAPATAATRSHLPAAVDLAGRTTQGALVGILARARGVLSNDSGVMHLAAALGTPVVGVFGSTNPAWTHPLGPSATWVVHPVPCAPCYRRRCPIDFPCMLQIEPAQLVVALHGLLAAISPDSSPQPSRL